MKQLRASIHQLVLQILLLGFSAVFVFPLFWMISTSLKASGQEFMFPPQWIPDPPRLENYVEALTVMPFHRYFANTIFITLAAMLGTLLSASLVAYGFARMQFFGRDFWFMVLLGTMMLPGVVTMIPTFILFRELRWIDTFYPLIVPAFFGGGAFNVFLFRQFFRTLPVEVEEAAIIDGAGTLRIYWQILLPLSRPVLATVAIFSFMGHWNEFMGPLIYLNSPEKWTLALAMRAFIGQFEAHWNWAMAVSTLMVIPILILFFAANRYFIQGIAFTGHGG